MSKFTRFFSAGIALVAFALAAPAAQAQTTDFASVSLASSTSVESSSRSLALPATDEPTQRLSAPPAPEVHAAYYNDAHKDLHQALAWMQETNALHPEYWNVYAEARIRLQLKDYAGAHATAQAAKKLALAASPPNADYVRSSEEVVAQATSKLK
ncbi:hypothetical protein [Hymenobacter bucti]|uniref:Tetratricopeptide repeat protein n=1 Tax=Hymenobacter bucti TaxID=1844114 RepID=A0ABW4QRN0_9BACT